MSARVYLATLFAYIALSACEQTQPNTTPVFHESSNPERLSDWGVITVRNDSLIMSDNVAAYDLATPLFTDYASKLRTVWMPEGAAAQYRADEAFDFPVGTVITKTFYYRAEGDGWNGAVMQEPAPTVSGSIMPLAGLRLMETRILVRREDGWAALPYIWNDEQTDAVLKRTGDIIPLTITRSDGRREEFAYVVPNANQCAGCHATNATTKEIQPIGLKARHLNKQSTFAGTANQLEHWKADGWLTGGFNAAAAPKNIAWDNSAEPLDARARAYLDINCSHCHNPAGAGDTSGLNLEPDATGPALGLCKSPIAAGGGSGGRLFDIVPGNPNASITVFRMETTDPGAMMPELGRSLAHDEGVALIAEWIATMEGECS